MLRHGRAASRDAQDSPPASSPSCTSLPALKGGCEHSLAFARYCLFGSLRFDCALAFPPWISAPTSTPENEANSHHDWRAFFWLFCKCTQQCTGRAELREMGDVTQMLIRLRPG